MVVGMITQDNPDSEFNWIQASDFVVSEENNFSDDDDCFYYNKK